MNSVEPHTGGRRILVVEDDDAIAELLEVVLSMAGFQVRLAASARVALDQFDAFAPDAAVIDIKLPDASGLDLLRILTQERQVNCPIMMLTTTVDPAIVSQALAFGARDYITKPFNDRQVVERIQRLTLSHAA